MAPVACNQQPLLSPFQKATIAVMQTYPRSRISRVLLVLVAHNWHGQSSRWGEFRMIWQQFQSTGSAPASSPCQIRAACSRSSSPSYLPVHSHDHSDPFPRSSTFRRAKVGGSSASLYPSGPGLILANRCEPHLCERRNSGPSVEYRGVVPPPINEWFPRR